MFRVPDSLNMISSIFVYICEIKGVFFAMTNNSSVLLYLFRAQISSNLSKLSKYITQTKFYKLRQRRYHEQSVNLENEMWSMGVLTLCSLRGVGSCLDYL
jgi:hypothetical protein